MKKPQSPCKDCEDREVGCHGKCEKYQRFHEDIVAYSEVVKVNKMKDAKVYYRSGGKEWIR